MKKCLVCGVSFYKKVNESRIYWKNKKYCSSKCSLQKTSIRKQEKCFSFPKGHISWNKDLEYNDEMKAKMNTEGLKLGRGMFKGKKLPQFSGKNSARWLPKTIKYCPICKKEMALTNWNKNRIYCSLKCRGLDKRDEKSPVYKGELALRRIRRKLEEMPEYIEWRMKILKRDNFRCKCGSNKNLHIHHIFSLSDIIKKYNIKTQKDARKCKMLWSLKNGATLCRDCHRKTDNYLKKIR